MSQQPDGSRFFPQTINASLAFRALQVLVGWNRERVQAESAALEEKPAPEHVYTLFSECRGTGNPDAAVHGVYMNAEAGNDAALAANNMDYEDLYDDIASFDRDFCLTLHRESDDPPFADIDTVQKQRLHGSIPSAAPLDAATARALNVAAGAQLDSAAALFANADLCSSRVDDKLFAVVRYFYWHGEAGGQLRSVWRSRMEAMQEARKLTGEDEWQRVRRAVRRGRHFYNQGALTAGDNLSDDSGASDGDDKDDDDGYYSELDYCDVFEVKLTH
eukprot:TRINITY_DN2119_c0_g1_i1.p2 TRINITY_DN2119_c0_g1~~TRINITY_DN2119_c0_g1_i1.p2  ORF type:complete len:275 (-),score=75.91 TRINITY_DN2119_c0_g1_i1:207-1031(-)